MAALFIGKRGMINICRQYNKTNLQSSSRCFAAQGSDGATMNEARQEAMGTNTDTKAPGVSVSYAADTAKEGIKRATDLSQKQSENAPTAEETATTNVEGGEDESEENVTVGEIGTVKGQNQSSS